MKQALPDAGGGVYRVAVSSYASLHRSVWGGDIAAIRFPTGTDAECGAGPPIVLSATDRAAVNQEYDRVARSIAAFKGSAESNRYSTKFDACRAGAPRSPRRRCSGGCCSWGRDGAGRAMR